MLSLPCIKIIMLSRASRCPPAAWPQTEMKNGAEVTNGFSANIFTVVQIFGFCTHFLNFSSVLCMFACFKAFFCNFAYFLMFLGFCANILCSNILDSKLCLCFFVRFFHLWPQRSIKPCNGSSLRIQWLAANGEAIVLAQVSVAHTESYRLLYLIQIIVTLLL